MIMLFLVKEIDKHLITQFSLANYMIFMKDVLYEVRCLKSNEDMILALTGQFKQLSREPEKFFRFTRQLLKLSSKCEDHIFI